MRKIFKNFDSFHVIFIFFGIFFSFIMLLSIPSLFDYKALEPKISKTIESDYNLKFSKIKNIKYRFVPSPHLLIENANLSFPKKDNIIISELKNTKIFISLFKLYDDKSISIKKIKIDKENFNFNSKSLKYFLDHLYTKKNKNLIIEKSNFFFSNKKKEVVTISPIKKITYRNDIANNKKILKANGKLFDIDYDLNWSQDLAKPKISNFEFKFKNPNILIENTLNEENPNKTLGTIKINFLSEKYIINYNYDNDIINIESLANPQNKIEILGEITLDPFHFELDSKLKKQDIDFLIKYILLNYYNYKDKIHRNISGNLKINLEKIQNAYLNQGYLKLFFSNSKLTLSQNNFNIRKIGSLNLNKNFFYENNGAIFFATIFELNISNEDEFYRRFSIPKKNRVKLDKITGVFEKNIDKSEFMLSSLTINDEIEVLLDLDIVNSPNKISFDNFQKFRNIILDLFKETN